MATLTYFTGFECGCDPTTRGLGLWNSVNGSPVVDTAVKRTGSYSLKIDAPGGGTSYNCRKNLNSTPQIAVATFHFYVPTGGNPSPSTIVAGFTFGTYGTAAGLNLSSTNTIRMAVGTGTPVGTTSLTLDTWHRIDLRLNITASTWTIEWYLNGVQQTNAELTGQPTNDTIVGFRLGSSNTTVVYKMYFDDVALSETSADYPIGNIGVEVLVPNADGTHNAGTNVIEDQAGNDIGAVTAYDKINSIPASATTYIRQAANGTGNYAEVLFGNMVSSYSSIFGAIAILAYTSETTTSNNGGCMVSKDGFSTNTVLWGSPGALADYSDGSTASLYWKTALVSGANTTETVNALTARLGYSGDANPDPYWIDLMVEVAYVPASSNDIDLDLVTFSSTIPDLTIIENEIVPLDLVSYANTFPDTTTTENVVVDLDLVIFSITYQDLTVLENVAEPLDLVGYSITVNDLDILENEVVQLDLVSHSNFLPEITILENEVVLLDLVTQSSVYPNVDLEEQSIIDLDLVSYSSSIQDLNVLENEIVVLDLVSYSSSVQDLVVTEQELLVLDLVTYSIILPDITILENVNESLDLVIYSSFVLDADLLEESDIDLDLVVYPISFPDIIVLESEIELLDLVTYSSTYQELILLENVSDSLDLVLFTSVVNNVLLVTPYDGPITIDRIYSIPREYRIFSIVRGERTMSVAFCNRVYPIR